MAQFPKRARRAAVRSGAVARICWSDSGVAVQCCRDRAASIGVVAGEMDAPAAVEFPHQLHHALCESRLEPHKFGVAAPEPGRVDADHVLEAADRKVVALLGGGGGRAVRRIRAVDEGQFLQGMAGAGRRRQPRSR